MPRLSGHVNVEALSAQNREKASAMGSGTPRPEIHSLAFASRFTDKDIPKVPYPLPPTPALAAVDSR
jgi:hypothetical protein